MSLYIYRYSKPTVTDAVLKALLPGSITVVFHRSDCLNKDLNPGVDLVGIRIPDYPAVVRLVELCGTPLALTSANISQAQSSLEIEVGTVVLLYVDFQKMYFLFVIFVNE